MAAAIANDPSLVGVPSRPAAQPTYFAANPDVAAEYTKYSSDYTPEQFAEKHYTLFGVNEGRAAPTFTPTATVAAPLNMQSVATTADTGATTTTAAPNYEQMVRDAYGSIGRTGVGDAASNIDQAGFDYWLNTLQSGASTPEAFNRNFQTAVADYLVTKPQDQYSTYVTDFLTDTKPAAVSGIVDLYRDVLGRAPDAGGLGYWFQQFGSEISPEERAVFRTAAHQEKVDPLIYAYELGVESNDFSALATLLAATPDPKSLIADYGLNSNQINQIEAGTNIDLDGSGAIGYNVTLADNFNASGTYSAFVDNLRNGDVNPIDAINSLNVGADAKQATINIYNEILSQQDAGTEGDWGTGTLASKQAAAAEMAWRLAEGGAKSLQDIGVRQVERRVEDGEGGVSTYLEPEYFSKSTGQLVNYNQNSGGLKLNYHIHTMPDGTVVPIATKRRSDWMNFREDVLKPAVSLASLAFPALAPYVAAGNAINAASKGDWGTAIVSALSAVPGFNSVLKFSPETLSTINTAKTTAQVLNALDKGNPVALATALAQTTIGKDLMLQDMGNGITLGDVVNTAKIAKLAGDGNYAEALATAGELTNSPNLRLAASAESLRQAVRTGDPFKIIAAVGQLDRATKAADTSGGGIQNRVADDTTPQGDGVTNVLADAGLITSDGQFANTSLTDADVADITGVGTTTGSDTQLASSGTGAVTDAGGGGTGAAEFQFRC
jgi:hypothetical protein